MEIADKYNRMIYENVNVDIWKYGLYLFFEKTKTAFVLIMIYKFFKIPIVERILFMAIGMLFGITIGGYTRIYGINAIWKASVLFSDYIFYLIIIFIVTRFKTKGARSIISKFLTIFIVTVIYIAVEIFVLKNNVTIL